MIQKIDHIGIAVLSLEQAIPLYERALGLKCEKIEEVADQSVKTAFFEVGGVHLELLEPTSPDSPVAKFLEQRGPGLHHIAFGTRDLLQDLEQAREAGVALIDQVPREGAGGKEIAFLHPKSTLGVLMELCRHKAQDAP